MQGQSAPEFPYYNSPKYKATSDVLYTVGINDVILDLTNASAQTVTLPAASSFPSRMLVIVNNTTTAKTISTYTNIAGTTSATVPITTNLNLISNGTTWGEIDRNFTDAANKTFNGNIVLAGTTGNTLTIGNSTGAVTINSGTGAMNIGSASTAQAVNLATGTGNKTLVLGSTNSTSSSTLRSGSSGITLSSTATSNAGITVTSSNTSGSAIALTNSSLTSGVLLNLPSTSASKTSAARGIRVQFTGAQSNSNQTTTATEFSNTQTGTNQTNVALTASASGGTNNYAALFPSGRVGVGISTPANALSINGITGYPATTLANNPTLVASTSIDLTEVINIPQTTAGAAIALPNPTVISETRRLVVNNTGTVSFTMGGIIIPSSGSETFVWNAGAGTWVATSANKVVTSFRAVKGATQSIATATATDVTWGSTTDNTNSAFVAGTGIFTAPIAGLYLFTSSLRFDYNTTPIQEQYLEIVASGGQTTRGGFSLSGVLANATSFYYANATAVYRLTAGETVKVVVRQDSGLSQNLNGTQLCSFSGYYIPDRY